MAGNLRSSYSLVDPLFEVILGSGPIDIQGNLETYAERFRETDRKALKITKIIYDGDPLFVIVTHGQ